MTREALQEQNKQLLQELMKPISNQAIMKLIRLA